MVTFFSRAAWIAGLLVVLSGCAQTPSWMHSPPWLGGSNVAQKPPAAQTLPPVQSPADSRGQNNAVSRLDREPWPSNMGKPTPLPPSDGKIRVAILLPLTGANAALGQAMLNSAQQAVFDAASPTFELMPRDTGSGEEMAETAARDAIASGAQLLIGPLFATSVPAVHQVAQLEGISMLTLSTDTTLAAPNLYVMGFAPGAQVERVVHLAASRGMKRFAALVPGTAYGQLVATAYQQAVLKEGGTLVAVLSYNPVRHDAEMAAHKLANMHDDLDALLLPEGGGDLAAVSQQLTAAGFDTQTVHLLGTGLWDVPGLGTDVPYVVGGWYAASDPLLRKNFVATYTTTYGQAPPRLVTLAYDATALAAVLAKRGAKFDQPSLTNANGFAGLDGIFRLTPAGLVERGLAVNEVTSDAAKVIDPAPNSFAPNAK